MDAYPGFGTVLRRVLAHRGTEAGDLAAAAGVAEPELRAVLGGAVPDEALLHALGPALGYRVPDLYVWAEVPVPLELTPLDRGAGHRVRTLLEAVMVLPAAQRLVIHRSCADLPQETRPPVDPPKREWIYSPSKYGFGAVLSTMVCTNRNLGIRGAYMIARLTGGRMYLSPSTYDVIGRGLTALRPDWILSFAAVSGIPAGDLSAITGIPLPEQPLWNEPLIAELADLLWNCRRLTTAQAAQLGDQARAMFVPIPQDADKKDWNVAYQTSDGVSWGAPRDPVERP